MTWRTGGNADEMPWALHFFGNDIEQTVGKSEAHGLKVDQNHLDVFSSRYMGPTSDTEL